MPIADKNYYGRGFESELADAGLGVLRPARKGGTERPGAQFFKPLPQVIESINDTFKGQPEGLESIGCGSAGVTHLRA